ncbi:TonB-dependent receptor [Saccharobesus litoralis]|uniref:TonB-dependent receptor n=1 Tax=Saccharobesus litoralis TaxID=2172099 RepID=A0A2S0VT81_9ALTE|nr:TonB-dependent receptor [Saccharobesus litoralis]AWB67428.1 TonB-dependent receptor [Saccharobesus litoralis]
MKSRALTLAILLSNSNYVLADNDDLDEFGEFYGGDQFIEIATGLKTQIHKAPAVASVFTAEQIKAMGAIDIDDVLETVPGLHISRLSDAYQPIYTFRGVHSSYNSQVLMLINGVPITNIFTGNRNNIWGGMPVESIARIEIMRGPGSAVYGADAFAGVINIMTKSSQDIKSNEFSARAGSFNSTHGWMTVSDSIDDLSYSATFESHKTNGPDNIIESDAQSLLDALTSTLDVPTTNASLAPGKINLGAENTDIRLEVLYKDLKVRAGMQRRDNVGSGAGLAEALDPEAKLKSTRINFDINYHGKVDDELSFDTQLAFFKTSSEIKNQYTLYPAGSDSGFDSLGLANALGLPSGIRYPEAVRATPEVFEKHTRLNITGLYSGLTEHAIRFGAGYHLADLYKVKESKNFGIDGNGNPISAVGPLTDVSDTDAVFIRETERSNFYLFAQDVWAFAADWELTAGVRYDDYDDFGSTVNPRLAMVWATSLNLSTKLLYGKAFRAPSFTDLGAKGNPVALGNANLSPEEMETIELVVDYHADNGLGVVWNIYSYEWRDIIIYRPVADAIIPTKVAQNYGRQTAFGTEVEVNWKASDNIALRANIAYTQPENDLTGQNVPFIPEQQFYAQLDWKISNNLSFNLKNNYVSQRKRDKLDPRANIDDYWITDFKLSWSPAELPIELAMIGRNIFDVDAREPSINNNGSVNLPNDLPLAGRNLFGEIRFKF